MMVHADRVIDVFGIYGVRSAGHDLPLAQVLQARHVRIELMFTALGIALGKLAVPVMLARFVARRAELELLPLFILVMSVVQYVHFKQGADVHIFWPHPFALYFGLAAGALAATVRDGWRWLAPRIPRRLPRFLLSPLARPSSAPSSVGLPVLLVARDGASLVRLSRESGGRFMEVNLPSEIDQAVALRWFLAGYPATERIAFHGSVRQALEHCPGRSGRGRRRGSSRSPRPARACTCSTPASRPRPSCATRPAAITCSAVGWLWVMDRSRPRAPLDGFSFDEHDPGLFESLWHGATEPVRRVVPDPWVTWEWRTLLGQPAVAPTTAAASRSTSSGSRTTSPCRRQRRARARPSIGGRWSRA